MDAAPLLIQRITSTVALLPAQKAAEVLDFAQYLLAQESGQAHVADEIARLDPAQDPLLEYIGGISHGSLAANIDEALYGS
jgi:hypothetical protein